MNKKFLELDQTAKENLLMETAMMIMSIFDDMIHAQQLDQHKVNDDSCIERLNKFSSYAVEFEDKYYGTEEYEDDFIFLINEWASKKIDEEYGCEIEVFYTGGGIWLAEKDLNNGTYAVISSDWQHCLNIFKNAEEKYMPEDMIFSKSITKLNKKENELYHELLFELRRGINRKDN